MAKRHKIDTQEIRLSDEDLALRMEQRIKKRVSIVRRKKAVTLIIVIVVFALLGTMCGKDIVRLKAENIALKKQQAELEKQRDELKEELENVNDQEYIREQARKQLRLLNPGEILFTFDEEVPEESEETDEPDKTGKSEDSGGSDG